MANAGMRSITSYFKTAIPEWLDEGQENAKSKSCSKDYDMETLIPLHGPGFSWYKERGINAAANSVRTEEHQKNSVISENNEMMGLIRGSVTGSLTQNIDDLIEVKLCTLAKTTMAFKYNDIPCTTRNGQWSHSCNTRTCKDV